MGGPGGGQTERRWGFTTHSLACQCANVVARACSNMKPERGTHTSKSVGQSPPGRLSLGQARSLTKERAAVGVHERNVEDVGHAKGGEASRGPEQLHACHAQATAVQEQRVHEHEVFVVPLQPAHVAQDDEGGQEGVEEGEGDGGHRGRPGRPQRMGACQACKGHGGQGKGCQGELLVEWVLVAGGAWKGRRSMEDGNRGRRSSGGCWRWRGEGSWIRCCSFHSMSWKIGLQGSPEESRHER